MLTVLRVQLDIGFNFVTETELVCYNIRVSNLIRIVFVFLDVDSICDDQFLHNTFFCTIFIAECLVPVDLTNDWLMPPASENDTSDTFIPSTTDTQSNVSCMSLVTLNRMETMNTDFKVMYSMTPFKGTNISVADYPRVVYFDVLPIKDIGGTLMVNVMVKPDIKVS